MTALPTDLLGEILHYVDDLSVINALALTCRAGAQFVRESADHIADLFVALQGDGSLALPNGVKHGGNNLSVGFSEAFVVTYNRGVAVSWSLNVDGDITRGHRGTHYVLHTVDAGVRFCHSIGVYCKDEPREIERRVDARHYGKSRRLAGYIIDDVIVPSVIEKWAAVAMNVTQPTTPYIVYCSTKEQADAIDELGLVDARCD